MLTLLAVAVALGAILPDPQRTGGETVAVTVASCPEATGAPGIWTSDRPLFDLQARPEKPDTRGVFHLIRQPRTPLYLFAAAAGCQADVREVAAQAVAITLGRGRDVAFQLRDGDGPVAGTVERKIGDYAVITTANAEGQGVLTGLGLGAETVTGRYQEVTAAVTVTPEAGSVVVTLPATGVIAGRVIDTNGRPVSGVTLTLIRNQAQEVRVAETGLFRAEQLPGGAYTLEAVAEGFRFHATEITLQKRQRATVVVRMSPGSQITVQFVTGTGEPLRKPRLEVESNSAIGFEIIDMLRPRRSFVGTADGRVEIRGLPLGVSQLVLNIPPFARLRIPPIEIDELSPDLDLGTVVVGEGATLHATVRDASGNARGGVSVQIDRGPGVSALDPAVAQTDAEGQAAIGRLGPGRYRVRVGGDDRPGGSSPFAEEWVRLSESDTRIDRTYRLGGIALSVTAGWSAGPLRHTRVAVMPGPGDPPEVEGFVVQTATRMINRPFNPGVRAVTDEAGHVTLPDVPPGPARLAIVLPAFTWSMPITVGATDSSTAVMIPPVSAELLVRDAVTGAGVPSRITWRSQGTDVRITASADPSGRVAIEGLIDGPAVIEVEARDYVPARLELATPTTIPLEVLLDRTPQTSLTIHLQTPEGSPVQGASAELVQVSAKRWKRVAVSGSDGALRFANIDTAAARLVVRHPLFATTSADLPVNGPGTLGLVLRPGYRTILRLADEESSSRTPVRLDIALSIRQGSSVRDSSDDVFPRTATPGAEIELGVLASGQYRAVVTSPTRTRHCDFLVEHAATMVPCPQ